MLLRGFPYTKRYTRYAKNPLFGSSYYPLYLSLVAPCSVHEKWFCCKHFGHPAQAVLLTGLRLSTTIKAQKGNFDANVAQLVEQLFRK